MVKETEKMPAAGLQSFRPSAVEQIVRRPDRRPIGGAAFNSQKCQLILDTMDAAGNDTFPCKVADVSDRGIGVVCRAAETNPELFKPGARIMLVGADGKRLRVEVRWNRNGRLGLRRFDVKHL